ncbi:tetratricopeptide repeat protein [Mesorhizobium koreense]|uniref:tetratricopeptide repeat protein n=1 Tax=Mesorhizobium koreense TaxID=3074855 RepID=UPI00287BC4FC|nr:tetratricopeptide repeat protein [Mesorhizobium sp. WR6]
MFRVTRLRGAFFVALVASTMMSISGCDSAEERAQSYYKSGLELLAKGEPIKASLEFRNAIKLDSNFVEALFALGKVEEQQGRFDSAAKIYLSVAEKDPKHVKARVRLSYIFLAAGHPDAALKYAEQAVSVASDDPEAMVAKAAVQLKLNNRGDAVQLSQAALKKDPHDVDAMMVLASERILASDLQGALDYLNKAPAGSERNIGLQVLRLNVLDKLNDQPGVEKLLKKLVTLFPENSAFPLSLARWYLSKGRGDDAEKTMYQFAADNPENDRAQLGLITFLNKEDGPQAAVEEANKIVEARAKRGKDAFTLRMAIAQLEFAAGNQSKAVDLMHSIIDSASNDENRNKAQIQLATMFTRKKDWVGAEKLTNAVLENDSKNVDALRVRASVRLSEGNTDKGIDDLLAALNEAPDDTQLRSLLAEAYERKGSVVVAGEQYAKAMSLDNNSPTTGLPYVRFLLRYGRTDQALNVLESVRKAAPKDREVLKLLAQLKLDAGDWVGAQQIADALRHLDRGPADPSADRIAAAALGGLDKYNESISLLQKSLTTNADSPSLLSDLVRTYMRAGRQSQAEQYLKTVLKENSSNVEAHILLGSVYMSTNRSDLAKQAFQDAAVADKKGVLGDASLAQFYLATGDPQKAEAVAREGLTRDDKNQMLHSLLGTIYQQQERFDDAIAQYELLLKANPGSPVAANDLASLLSERRGDKQSLDRAFDIAQRFRNSQIPQYLDTLGWIYYLRSEYASALPLIRTAAQRMPRSALVQYHLGMVLKALGQQEPAVASLKQAISLTPPLIKSDMDKAQGALQQLATKPPHSAKAAN